MRSLWTWGGKYFGYLDGADLWTNGGKHVGKRQGNNIFSSDGRYLGEMMSDERLITDISKKSERGSGFSPAINRVGRVGYAGYVGYTMDPGHEDFPSPDEL